MTGVALHSSNGAPFEVPLDLPNQKSNAQRRCDFHHNHRVQFVISFWHKIVNRSTTDQSQTTMQLQEHSRNKLGARLLWKHIYILLIIYIYIYILYNRLAPVSCRPGKHHWRVRNYRMCRWKTNRHGWVSMSLKLSLRTRFCEAKCWRSNKLKNGWWLGISLTFLFFVMSCLDVWWRIIFPFLVYHFGSRALCWVTLVLELMLEQLLLLTWLLGVAVGIWVDGHWLLIRSRSFGGFVIYSPPPCPWVCCPPRLNYSGFQWCCATLGRCAFWDMAGIQCCYGDWELYVFWLCWDVLQQLEVGADTRMYRRSKWAWVRCVYAVESQQAGMPVAWYRHSGTRNFDFNTSCSCSRSRFQPPKKLKISNFADGLDDTEVEVITKDQLDEAWRFTWVLRKPIRQERERSGLWWDPGSMSLPHDAQAGEPSAGQTGMTGWAMCRAVWQLGWEPWPVKSSSWIWAPLVTLCGGQVPRWWHARVLSDVDLPRRSWVRITTWILENGWRVANSRHGWRR